MFNSWTTLGATVLIAASAAIAMAAAPQSRTAAASFYDLKTTYLDGRPADLGTFRGKVVLADRKSTRLNSSH